MSQSKDVIIIGAGIIGVTTALALSRAGFRVRLIDRKGVAAETSRGNAGAFAFAEIEPLAAPGIMRKAPRWLVDPLGPLSVRPAYAFQIAPWMYHFWRSSQKDRYAKALEAQAGMMRLSRSAFEKLVAEVSAQALIRREGQLQLYESRAEYDASLPAWDLRAQHGVDFQLLRSPAEIAEIQPGLAPRFTHGGFTPDWTNVVDPEVWTQFIAREAVAAGTELVTANVRAIQQTEADVELQSDTGVHKAHSLIIAAGAWSHILARSLGEKIPLETERGYNTTFRTASFDLRTHVNFANHGFVVSRIGDGLRVGGAVELGGLRLPPNYKRSDTLVRKAAAFMPGFDPKGGTAWMGYRPSMPDSLPVIGRSSSANRVIYTFGHGHLGLTQSAGTAELVRDILLGVQPALSLAAFEPLRFARA